MLALDLLLARADPSVEPTPVRAMKTLASFVRWLSRPEDGVLLAALGIIVGFGVWGWISAGRAHPRERRGPR